MPKALLILSSFLLLTIASFGQKDLFIGSWKGSLTRKDSIDIVFLFTVDKVNSKYEIKVKNGEEELLVNDVHKQGDSLFFDMPFFESSFRVALLGDGTMKGIMRKGTSGDPVYWQFSAIPGVQERFKLRQASKYSLTGRWAVNFTNASGKSRPAVAEFVQQGDKLKGSFLTPSGDYRYLEGIVSGDSLYLSAFDGSHVYLFTARVADEHHIASGWFYSGSAGKEQWNAVYDPDALLPDAGNTPVVIDPSRPLTFTFPDLDSNMVSLEDERFRNKVVVLQIMGSWCPNCMDETRFLSEYYKNNRNRGVEVIALAYEYSTDFRRSRNSLMRFRDRFDVAYPFLNTGVRVNDSLRTEKTLPNITTVKVFPTTLFLGKDHTIRKIETGFNGPGTGIHYDIYRKEFSDIVEELLKE
jgi:thiol-disulfide isomerase/thioredoxin